MKKKFLVLGILLLSLPIFAQDNAKGIEYYKAELYDFAKTFFEQQNSNKTELKAEKYYYLGLISIEEKNDSAQLYFEMATTIAKKSPWGYIGKGYIALKDNNEEVAEAYLKKAYKYSKKRPAAIVAIAEAYFVNGKKDKANEYIELARKRDNEYSGIYLAEGDFLMESNKVGDAMGKYEQAQYFNTKDKLATLKLARMYVKMNRKDLAYDQLNSIFSSEPNNIPATIVFGEIKNSENKFKEAIAAFEKVIAVGNAPINVYERYAQALYFDKQYQKALDQTKYCIEQNPNNIASQRIRAYCSLKLGKYQETKTQIAQLMKKFSEKRLIYNDYTAYAEALEATTQKTLKENATHEDTISHVNGRKEIIKSYEKAIELKPEIVQTYKDFAKSYYSFFEYDKAVEWYEKYFEKNQTPLGMDYYAYSDACSNSAKILLKQFSDNHESMDDEAKVTNRENFMLYIDKGIKANENLISLDTNLYLGYYGKANTQSIIDDYEKVTTKKIAGIAKESYEKAIEKMLPQNNDNKLTSFIVDAYKYLSTYYISNSDVKSVIAVNQQILLIDPSNERAKYVLTKLNAPLVANPTK